MGPSGVWITVEATKSPSSFWNISTVSLLAHATARSGRPSPLKSAATTERHSGPVGSCCTCVNVPSPLPSRIVRADVPMLTTARSVRPSPLKSAATTDQGAGLGGDRRRPG